MSLKSLLDQNFVMVARLAKSKILDEELLQVIAKHLQDRSTALEAARANQQTIAEDRAAVERAELVPILLPPCTTPLRRKRDEETDEKEVAKWQCFIFIAFFFKGPQRPPLPYQLQ